MAHEDIIMADMESLVIADKHIIGDLMAHAGIWNKGTSSVNNSYKELCKQVDAGKLEKGDGYFRLVGCKSEYKEHAQLLTKALAEIIKLNLNAKINREKELQEIGLRPDALILLTRENQQLCIVLEVCNNEFPEYLTQKVNTWKQWDGATDALSKLFETQIKAYDIVVLGDTQVDGVFEFNSYLTEVQK
jgi:hypothetical protein